MKAVGGRIFFGVFLLCILSQTAVKAQDNEDQNIQTYTPSVLLSKGQWEYKFFNNIYTQTQGFDQDGVINDNGSRATYFASINQFLIGAGSRINVGADVWVKAVRNGATTDNPFGILSFENSFTARTALSYIGPKVKIAPFKKIEKLSVQSTLLIPIANDMEGTFSQPVFLSQDAFIWINQFFDDKAVGEKFQLFVQLAPWLYIDKKFTDGKSFLSTPLSVFFSWFPTKRITLYTQNEVWPSYGTNPLISSWFYQLGGGGKLQVIPGKLEAEILYTKFLAGKNAGAGQTFNFGLRFLR